MRKLNPKSDGNYLKLSIEILACAVVLGAGCATSSTPGAFAPGVSRGGASVACDAETTCDAAASRDCTEYQLGAEQEREHAALMMILMTSRPH